MPRSKTATDCDVFDVSSLAVNRPVQPPPMMATSTGLRLVMREPRFLLRYQLFGAVQSILPRPVGVVEVRFDLLIREPRDYADFRSVKSAESVADSNLQGSFG